MDATHPSLDGYWYCKAVFIIAGDVNQNPDGFIPPEVGVFYPGTGVVSAAGLAVNARTPTRCVRFIEHGKWRVIPPVNNKSCTTYETKNCANS